MYNNYEVSADKLRSIIERVENLEEEKKQIAEYIREVFDEAKNAGLDIKAIRKILSMRKMKEHDRMEQEYVLETYMRALGMIIDVSEE